MLVGTGIITTVLCTRLHMLATIVISFYYSAILYPIVAHWLWVGHGWMQSAQTIVADYAHGVSVYTTASTFAGVGAIILGRRLLRFSEISEISVVSGEVSKNTVTGYILVIIGLIAFSLPTPEEEYRLKYNRFDGVLFTNNVLALSAAGLVTIILDVTFNCRTRVTYWPLIKYLQAAVAGIVALSCGINTFSPTVSFIIGLIAGVVFFFIATLIQHFFIEDNCNIIACCFVNSFLASIFSQLFPTNENIFKTIHHKNLLWQLACHLIIFAVSFLSAVIILLLLYVSNYLKSGSEILNHSRATAVYKNKMFLNFSKTVKYIEPGVTKPSDEEFDTVNQILGSASRESMVSKSSSSDVSNRKSKRFINLQENTARLKKPRP